MFGTRCFDAVVVLLLVTTLYSVVNMLLQLAVRGMRKSACLTCLVYAEMMDELLIIVDGILCWHE